MAYFHGNPPEISAATASDGGLQTLILMNPTTYIQFSDHHHHQQDDDNDNNNTNSNNFVFLNPHAPPQTATQQFVGIPLAGHHESSATAAAELHGFLPRVQYNLYNNNNSNNNHHVDPIACETPRASSQQGLSLTLSSQQQQRQQSQQQNLSFGFGPGDEIRVGSGSTVSGLTNSVVSGLLSSKYLRAAQELLDEVVNVNNSNELLLPSTTPKKASSGGGGDAAAGESSAGVGEGSGGGGGDVTGKRVAELSTAERQEIQMKKAKLISMLHEVDQRYRQYHHQMQIVISSFEQAAGIGSAKSYTSLALKTISRQFRCLKDAISGQIETANKSLGEEESVSGGGRFEGSRLKFVDHHLRQQRALQQLGMIQHPNNNAWRPQRGLPERAVSVLRAWLFEHFLHPYPKDSDKHMLAKQTGLTRSQVSNWFINARVRLWKPMVEEMYLEEMKEQEKNNGPMDKTVDENNEDSASKSMSNHDKSSVGAEDYQLNSNLPNRNVVLEGVIGAQGSPKRLRTSDEMLMQPMNTGFNPNEKLTMKILEERQGLRDGYSFVGNFGQYQMDEMPRFDVSDHQHLIVPPRTFSGNNGVSLTLGLPHCESLSATHHQNFMPNHNIQLGRRVKINGETDDFGAMNASASTPHSSSVAYNGINMENQKRFVAQLLPDLVS